MKTFEKFGLAMVMVASLAAFIMKDTLAAIYLLLLILIKQSYEKPSE